MYWLHTRRDLPPGRDEDLLETCCCTNVCAPCCNPRLIRPEDVTKYLAVMYVQELRGRGMEGSTV